MVQHVCTSQKLAHAKTSDKLCLVLIKHDANVSCFQSTVTNSNDAFFILKLEPRV